MNIDELKLRLNNSVNDIVDKALPRTDIISNIGNATVKFFIEQNMYKLDNILTPFADQNRDIDTERYLFLLESQVFKNGQVQIDIVPYLKQYVPEQFINFIPAKIIINKEDIVRILQK